MNGQCCGGGVRFRLFPKPPYVHPEWPPETISVSSPPGSIGPGPADDRMRLIVPVDKRYSYGVNAGPLGTPKLDLPPFRGPVHRPVCPDDEGNFDGIPHMGSFGSRGEIRSCKVKLRRQFRYPRSEPVCMTRLVSEHDQPHIRSPLETAAPRSRLRRAGAQGGETILWIGFFRPWLLSVRPPGSARTDQVLEDLIIC